MFLKSAARSPLAAPIALVAPILFMLAAAGCSLMPSKPQPIAPTSPEGKACAARCELPRTQCQKRQELRETDCNANYQIGQAEYAQCLKSGAARCRAPYTCLGADMSICAQQYDDCFAACSGKLERRAAPNGSAATPSGEPAAIPAQSVATPDQAPGSAASAPSAPASKPAKSDPP